MSKMTHSNSLKRLKNRNNFSLSFAFTLIEKLGICISIRGSYFVTDQFFINSSYR